MKELRNYLINGPQKNGFNEALCTTRMVIEHVSRKYGIEYKESGMRDVLHRAGFSSRKPRPTPYKASRKYWAAFRKMPEILLYSAKGYKVFYLDESTYSIAPIVKKGWYAKVLKV